MAFTNKKVDILVAGVGGQGTILASDILAEVGLRCGYDVKKAEVHGMSQRGGAVESHIRWGEKVFSPQVEAGKADYLLGFEMLETARWTHFLALGGTVLINRHRIPPPSVNLGAAAYPSEEEIESVLGARAARVWWIDGTAIARKLGNQTVAGMVILGAFSKLLDQPGEVWTSVIADLVPEKFVELNLKAFGEGRGLPLPAQKKGGNICETSV
ncbi:MAG: indolepyruvate oxidoreductase subunit beta [Peptococcaceae bacterium]|nr:indolepyruvate oxidoreductase subunit beta [Peptococcaceae bacterium]